MILIDQDTDAILAKRLDSIKNEMQNTRCIYLRGDGQPLNEPAKEMLMKKISRHIPSVDLQAYVCGDGDIFILAPSIHTKSGKEFLLDMAAHRGKPVSNEWAHFVELPLSIHPLLAVVEAKLDKQRKAEEEKRKQVEQLQAERKRQAILNGGTTAKQENIKNRRAARRSPEMMIIEDDIFSRRLVENVLQQRYPLTGLGEATYALETYARIAPDLLFLDINLPDVSGHELLEKIIALDPDAYVIMLSGNSDRENITQAMNKGAKGFVAKPFNKEKLFQYIERCPAILRERQ